MESYKNVNFVSKAYINAGTHNIAVNRTTFVTASRKLLMMITNYSFNYILIIYVLQPCPVVHKIRH